MGKSKKSSNKSSSLKEKCDCLAKYCRTCCNDVIDMLCVCDEKSKKLLCDYLKCCLILCEVCCCCSCCINMNCMTGSQMTDLVTKCNKICNCCDKLKKVLTASQYKKIGCEPIRKCCESICGNKKSSKTSKKGGAIRFPSEYFGGKSGSYFDNTRETGSSSPNGKLTPSK